MKGITYTQVAQYTVMIIAYLIPAIFLSLMVTRYIFTSTWNILKYYILSLTMGVTHNSCWETIILGLARPFRNSNSLW